MADLRLGEDNMAVLVKDANGEALADAGGRGALNIIVKARYPMGAVKTIAIVSVVRMAMDFRVFLYDGANKYVGCLVDGLTWRPAPARPVAHSLTTEVK